MVAIAAFSAGGAFDGSNAKSGALSNRTFARDLIENYLILSSSMSRKSTVENPIRSESSSQEYETPSQEYGE